MALTGYDADGHRARIETADVEATSDGFEVTDDGLQLERARDRRGHHRHAHPRRGLWTTVPLTHGTEGSILDFRTSPPSATTRLGRPAPSRRPRAGRRERRADARRAHDLRFTTSSATRGYYLVADEPVTVKGSTQALTMDVLSDGSGAGPGCRCATAAR